LLSCSFSRSRSRFTSCNATDTFIRVFGAALGHSRAPLSRSATNRPTDRPTNRSIP
jgi:hypothetical protein